MTDTAKPRSTLDSDIARLNKVYLSARVKASEALARKLLRRHPRNVLILTRLSNSLYEQLRYSEALRVSQRAFAIAPRDPQVLWDYANALHMLGDRKKAIEVYRSIVRRGAASMAAEDRSDDIAWYRSLVCDCCYRIASCYNNLGQLTHARRWLARYDEHRRHGAPSDYHGQDHPRWLRQSLTPVSRAAPRRTTKR